ncbi:MAG TPA: hypothetical protein VNT79_06340 [Phycisphaerae bacterium]|nr:hypothetical protein [Phycisphaerae bacterium]
MPKVRGLFRVWPFIIPLALGCEAIDVWRPPAPTDDQYNKGLIVFYPGSANLHMEGIGFFTAFQEAGLELAMEERQWSAYLEHFITPAEIIQPKITANARAEADRLAAYIRTHPGCPVTLISYSGGAVFIIQVAGLMPDDAHVDRVIIMSGGISKTTDLTAALEKTTQGIINYWSPKEIGPTYVSSLLGLADNTHLPPASTFGFDQVHPNLIQVSWSPDMSEFGNNGEHLDYIVNIPWLKQYVVPWVIVEKPEAG